MTLSLCMIVKNEAEVLHRTLATASIYADEIVIVDTGSTDDTVRIARSFTDKVFSYEWRDDFAAARNYAVSKSTGDFWMWLDADDIVTADNAKKIRRLFDSLDGKTDIVMLPYVLETDGSGKPLYSYYRERIIRRRADLIWRGRVHEAVLLRGNVERRQPFVLHAKPEGRRSGSRNLDIYKKMIAEGRRLEPRERYYYARELFYNGETELAAAQFEAFIAEPTGFAPNRIDACIMLSRCMVKLGRRRDSIAPLFRSFEFGLPTGEACCEIGLYFFGINDYRSAAYWLERAAAAKPDIESGAFVDTDYYGFLPFVWLTVCYDRMNKPRIAYRWHKKAEKLKPEHPSVAANRAYFDVLGFSEK